MPRPLLFFCSRIWIEPIALYSIFLFDDVEEHPRNVGRSLWRHVHFLFLVNRRPTSTTPSFFYWFSLSLTLCSGILLHLVLKMFSCYRHHFYSTSRCLFAALQQSSAAVYMVLPLYRSVLTARGYSVNVGPPLFFLFLLLLILRS